jgi:hypothetical protein
LGALVFGLIESSTLGLSAPLVIAALVVGVTALALFVWVEAREQALGSHIAPMVPLRLFRSRTFSGANLLTLLLYGALGGAFYFVPFNLQLVQGYSPAQAGAALLPMTLIIFALSRWAGGLIPRFGAKLPLIIGPSIATVGFALFAVPSVGGSYWTTFFPAVTVLSLGMAIVVAPLTTAVMGAVASSHAGVASGVNNSVSRTAGLLAIAVLNLVIVAVFATAFESGLAPLHLPADAHQSLIAQSGHLAAVQPPPGLSANVNAAVEHAVDSAFVAGFRVVMLIAAALALASAVVAGLLVEGKAAPVRAKSSPSPAAAPGSPQQTRPRRPLPARRRSNYISGSIPLQPTR